MSLSLSLTPPKSVVKLSMFCLGNVQNFPPFWVHNLQTTPSQYVLLFDHQFPYRNKLLDCWVTMLPRVEFHATFSHLHHPIQSIQSPQRISKYRGSLFQWSSEHPKSYETHPTESIIASSMIIIKTERERDSQGKNEMWNGHISESSTTLKVDMRTNVQDWQLQEGASI